jgi:catechol 2,3-dioxygenase-like lactoylglutathione lyase family enzyme
MEVCLLMPVAQSLDHFVVPVDDLVVAEEFYLKVFGGRVTRRNGLNVRQRKRGAVPHTFIQIGGKRMGVYLQSEERPEPAGARGLPTYSFTAGNHYALYTPQNSAAVASAAGSRMTGVGYLELEAPDVAASVDFYKNVLGFEVQNRSETQRQQATMSMASGQTLILTQAPFSSKGLVMSRKVPGPHIAFYVPAARWHEGMAHLDKLKIANGDRGAAKERQQGQGGTYMDDPAGYVIQFITDGME